MLTHLSLLREALVNCWCMWWAKNGSENWGNSAVHFTNMLLYLYSKPFSTSIDQNFISPKISLQNQPCKWWEWHKWSLNQILSNLTGQFLFWSLSRQKLISNNQVRRDSFKNCWKLRNNYITVEAKKVLSSESLRSERVLSLS